MFLLATVTQNSLFMPPALRATVFVLYIQKALLNVIMWVGVVKHFIRTMKIMYIISQTAIHKRSFSDTTTSVRCGFSIWECTVRGLEDAVFNVLSHEIKLVPCCWLLVKFIYVVEKKLFVKGDLCALCRLVVMLCLL